MVALEKANLIRLLFFQFMGIFAQVLTALPNFGLSIFIGRVVGVEHLAEYTFLTGISAVLFTMSLLGLRGMMLSSKTKSADKLVDYCIMRMYASIVLIVGLAVFFPFAQMPSILLIVFLMRFGDCFVEFILICDQLNSTKANNLQRYIIGHLAKNLLLIVAFASSYIFELDGLWLIEIAILIYCAFSFYFMIFVVTKYENQNVLNVITKFVKPEKVKFIFLGSIPFLGAQLICSLLTSLPRIAVVDYQDAVEAGIVSAVLTICTLAGMSFYAVWLRWSPIFGKSGVEFNNIQSFLIELTVVLVTLVLFFYFLGDFVVSITYGLELSLFDGSIGLVFVASIIFFFVMVISNLFKFSSTPWIESITYALPLIGGVIFIFMFEQFDMVALLLSCSAIMILTQISGFLYLKNRTN